MYDEIEKLILSFKGSIPDDVINDYLHLYKEEGWKILEWVCDSLADYNVKLTRENYDQIIHLVVFYGLNKSEARYVYLLNLIKD